MKTPERPSRSDWNVADSEMAGLFVGQPWTIGLSASCGQPKTSVPSW
jgi:hypothetical protein